VFKQTEYVDKEVLRHYVYVEYKGYQIPYELDEDTNTYHLYYAFYYDNETDTYYRYKSGNVFIHFWDFCTNGLMPKNDLPYPPIGNRTLWHNFANESGVTYVIYAIEAGDGFSLYGNTYVIGEKFE